MKSTPQRSLLFVAACLLFGTITAFVPQQQQQLQLQLQQPIIIPLLLQQTAITTTSSKFQQSPRRVPLLSRQKKVFRHPTHITTSNFLDQENDGDDNDDDNDDFFDGKTTAALVGGQSLLIVGSVAVAVLIGTPNFGLGPGFHLNWNAVGLGSLYAIPLGVLAAAMDIIEDKFPALQDVTKATQRSVLALLGGKFKPGIALITSLALGCVAGVGEEMLFRGVLRYELNARFGQGIAIALSSVIFGALHAVTPLYAILAALASLYFGGLYVLTSNLAVPITCHAVYDLVALMYAHWTVSKLTADEQDALSLWEGPGDP